MAGLLKQVFTWWSGSTIGTRLFTFRKGRRVGEDEFGNVYYEGSMDREGCPRRWVIYKGYSDPSMIPSGWHGWIHHRTDTPPVDENYAARAWQKSHLPNLTGSPQAYRPKGSITHHGQRPVVTGDYDAWSPEK